MESNSVQQASPNARGSGAREGTRPVSRGLPPILEQAETGPLNDAKAQSRFGEYVTRV
jgi:hypothetical protein